MRILAIETSCDETAAAVLEKDTSKTSARLLSNSLASSLALHARTGGIIPEQAAREQIKFIIPVVVEALVKSKGITSTEFEKSYKIAKDIIQQEIDAITVTVGPGLIGSLLVGVETAKVLSFALGKPLIPVNHLIGHLYANFIGEGNIDFPFVGLVVSGGHTDLLVFYSHRRYKWLGGTRDDAAGEAFDKIGRILGLSYPGGPEIEKAAKKGNPQAFPFPRPMLDSQDFDFSFSGLKTAVARLIGKTKLTEKIVQDIAASVQSAIVEVLVKKTVLAAQQYQARSVLIGGGVGANELLQKELRSALQKASPDIQFFCPPKELCTDNAAMIGAAALFNPKTLPWQKLQAQPELYFDKDL
jgi:N6-L-threonylcarbamoyladenine synthase